MHKATAVVTFFWGILILSRSFAASEDVSPCRPDICQLPNCFCSGTSIPGNLPRNETPQMIMLTFQNAIRENDSVLYLKVFGGLVNPNGCPITGTFFVSHEYSDYFDVQTMAAKRHEIGLNSVTWGDSADEWKTASVAYWTDEMKDQKTILNLMANISLEKMKGERPPFLQMGGNNQLTMLSNLNLLYDASRISVKNAQAPNLLWPYTYDYASTQDCLSPPCPNASFPGIWQIPLLDFKNKNGKYCAMLDGCDVKTESEAFLLLHDKFTNHYLSNRAPIVMTIGRAWVETPYKLQGLVQFLNYLQGLNDVYVLPADKVLDWIRQPTSVKKLKKFKPWGCDEPPPPICNEKTALRCYYDNQRRPSNATQATKRTRTCLSPCPPCYPWLHDPIGSHC